MLDQLITIDKLIFYFFNGVIANSFFDIIMPIITNENIDNTRRMVLLGAQQQSRPNP